MKLSYSNISHSDSFFYSLICVFLGPNTYNENETIAKYEIMDGAPVRGIAPESFLRLPITPPTLQ